MSTTEIITAETKMKNYAAERKLLQTLFQDIKPLPVNSVPGAERAALEAAERIAGGFVGMEAFYLQLRHLFSSQPRNEREFQAAWDSPLIQDCCECELSVLTQSSPMEYLDGGHSIINR